MPSRQEERMSKRSLAALALIGCALAASPAGAATVVVNLINVPDNQFTPQTVTIRIGDTVQWNSVAGIHNVFSDAPGLFSSGSPQASPWTYSFTFTAAGTFGYH